MMLNQNIDSSPNSKYQKSLIDAEAHWSDAARSSRSVQVFNKEFIDQIQKIL
jgi:hypothetical protein